MAGWYHPGGNIGCYFNSYSKIRYMEKILEHQGKAEAPAVPQRTACIRRPQVNHLASLSGRHSATQRSLKLWACDSSSEEREPWWTTSSLRIAGGFAGALTLIQHHRMAGVCGAQSLGIWLWQRSEEGLVITHQRTDPGRILTCRAKAVIPTAAEVICRARLGVPSDWRTSRVQVCLIWSLKQEVLWVLEPRLPISGQRGIQPSFCREYLLGLSEQKDWRSLLGAVRSSSTCVERQAELIVLRAKSVLGIGYLLAPYSRGIIHSQGQG